MQEVVASRDAYVAGRDVVHVWNLGMADERPAQDGAGDLDRWLAAARPVAEWAPHELGLHKPGRATAPREDSPRPAGLTPYVRRDLHEPLRASISRGGLHVVLGDSATGKTRLGYEAARDAVPDWRLLRPDSRQDLWRLADAGISDAVIWLENMEEFVGSGGLTPGMLNAMRARGNVAVIATLRIKARDDLMLPVSGAPGGGSSSRQIAELLERGSAWSSGYQSVLGIEFSRSEMSRAVMLRSQDSRIADALDSSFPKRVSQYLAGASAAIGRWESAENSDAHQVGAALIRAAVDFRRAGYFGPIPTNALLTAHSAYLRGGAFPSTEDVAAELNWVSASPDGLEPCLRVSGDACRAFDALVDHAQRAYPGHRPIEPLVWELALELSRDDPDKAFQVGRNAAHNYWERAVAIHAFRQASGQGHRDATYMLGWLLHVAGQREEAMHALTVASRAGHADAMAALAAIYREEGRRGEAAQVLTEAAAAWPSSTATTGRPGPSPACYRRQATSRARWRYTARPRTAAIPGQR